MALSKELISVIWTKPGRLQEGSRRTGKIRQERRREHLMGRRKGNMKKMMVLLLPISIYGALKCQTLSMCYKCVLTSV